MIDIPVFDPPENSSARGTEVEVSMDFRVLGPVEIIHGHRDVMPTAPKPRQVISLLLLRGNRVVQTSELIDELWESGPPSSAMTTLQTYIYKLRKIMAGCGAGERLETRPGGYLLTVPDYSLDLRRFEREADEGRRLLEDGDPQRAAEVLNGTLGLWRGPALADVVQGKLLSSYVTRLEELRFRTLELRIEADLRLGRHRELVSELKSLVRTHTLREDLHGSLMIALHRSGRRHEALETYRVLRDNMIEDLGLEPGPELKRLHQALLSDSVLDPPSTRHRAGPPRETIDPVRREVADLGGLGACLGPFDHAAVPAQIPADLADFTGRAAIIDEITSSFEKEREQDAGSGRTATRMVLVTGMPGVGKTALAVHLAHRLRPHFPDGQLYAELQCSTDGGRDVSGALYGFLYALGIPADQIPDSTRERSKLFRSTTAGRRLLVVLDDVVSPSEVAQLSPGDPRCAVIVTSRRRVHALAADWKFDLDILDGDEATELLARMVGAARLAREPRAAARLAELSGRLPLVLRCIGGRLAARPELPLGEMADKLARSPRVLDMLRIGELDVRSRFDGNYDSLSRLEQSVFRLLSMLPSADFTVESAAELLGWESTTVEQVIERIVDNHLIRITGCRGETRYAFHTVVRSYARERLSATLKYRPPEKSHPTLSLDPMVDVRP
ncbi:BTAD domain-containing putative transcriptional regulator [Spirillospora sp. NPDC029432]|uniref:AfsR/SARP family transcriptional regulator n=1 Tax=Spirillospora sp. NPDC029432 TaxID=3154599 RepID=UPI003453A21B